MKDIEIIKMISKNKMNGINNIFKELIKIRK